jgi:hypothetical protein
MKDDVGAFIRLYFWETISMINRGPRLFVVILVTVMSLVGCAPADSLFPLYTKDDTFFDETLLGAWRPAESPEKLGPDEGYVIFSGDKQEGSYIVRGVASARASKGMFLEARLVRLGKYTFIDFTTPQNTESLELHDLVFPYIRSHMIGRMQKTANSLRIDFLDSEWVDKESKAGRLRLSHLETPDGVVLSASTQDLQKFALENSEDDKAFSFTEYLIREK